MDTGASKCVIGRHQARLYCESAGIPFLPKPSHIVFRFGNGVQHSLGTIPVRIPTPIGTVLFREVDIVAADVPLLIGLEFLDEQCIYIDNTRDEVVCRRDDWSDKLQRKSGHLMWEWNWSEVLYTRSELTKLHKSFFHPFAQKLYNLIRRSRPEDATPETRQLLGDISRRCHTCQTFGARPLRFKVAMPDEQLVFNEELSMDLMWLDGKAVLHMVDTATGFNAAETLPGQSVEHVWQAFVSGWAALYPGYPNKLRVDQGSIFTSIRWQKLSNETGISLQLSGVESHHSLGKGERYHAPLRRIYLKIRSETPSLPHNLVVRLAVKAMNDSMGPEGLVPSLLVFGIMPRFPSTNSRLPGHRERMEAIRIANAEMATITAEMRIRQALRAKTPASADYVINPGDNVRVFRESDKRFLGPYRVVQVEGKQIFIERDGKRVQHNIDQIIPERIFNGDVPAAAIHAKLATFDETGHTATADHLSKMNPRERVETPRILLTELLKPNDPRGYSPEFVAAKKKEMDGLLRRGTWKVVLRDEVPSGANILGGRFVMSIKDTETDEPVYKARYVVQGHRGKEKNTLVHDAQTMRQSSISMVAALAAVFGFRLWSHDVSQAYLQSADRLMRDVFIKPSREFELNPDQLLQLLKPLYGLPDSGDYWHTTFAQHIEKDLGMTRMVGDLSTFFKYIRGRLAGIAGTYVDDCLMTGNDEFRKLTDKTLQRFDSRDRVVDNFTFAGIELETSDDGFLLHQGKQADKLRILPLEATFSQFKSAVMSLAWLCHTRPEISCVVAQAAQVTQNVFDADAVKQINSTIRAVKREPRKGIKHRKLDLNSLRLQVYSDSSFANNRDSSSQLGYLIVMADASNRCNILQYRSFKSRRVTRSVLGAEVYAFAEAFDAAFIMKHDLENVLGRQVPVLAMLTDSKGLFDVITKNSITSERRLMIDLLAARQAYSRLEISDIGLVRTQYNPADAFTKVGRCSALERMLDLGVIDHPVEQWVIRQTDGPKPTGESPEP